MASLLFPHKEQLANFVKTPCSLKLTSTARDVWEPTGAGGPGKPGLHLGAGHFFTAAGQRRAPWPDSFPSSFTSFTFVLLV